MRSGRAADLCPSARALRGARILGVVSDRGQVAYLGDAPLVDAKFLENAGRSCANLESRLRFASDCQKGGCLNWTGSKCGLPEKIGKDLETMPKEHAALPRCGIRHSCLWFAQEGLSICLKCRHVVTDQDTGSTET